MLAGHVDGDNDGKFDEDEPSVVAPSPATTIGGFDFHFGCASEGQYAQRWEKVSVKTKTLVWSTCGDSMASPGMKAYDAVGAALRPYWRSRPSPYSCLSN